MCGISGLWYSKSMEGSGLREVGSAMGMALEHRGPDAGGVWTDAACGLVLAHRRLSILDLTEAGSQPMRSSCGRFVLSYNGECYNFPELRSELAQRGTPFRGHSDTEVIVEGFSKWGVPETIRRLNGMFALAAWDVEKRKLLLARDRIGIKPLYYGGQEGMFWFGSELKSLRCVPGLRPAISHRALRQYFKFGYIPAPDCIFEGFRKLSPGQILEMHSPEPCQAPVSYWPGHQHYSAGGPEMFSGEPEQAVEELDSLLRKSVKQQMVSDVPLGAFLSGGIDSSTVVALMQAQSTRKVKTFTIGFDEAGFNEADAARDIARHLGTDHTEYLLSPGEACGVLPTVIDAFDEPFADSSQIPTYVVSRLARSQVTVSLSGDGGDELFAGYGHYPLCDARLRRIRRLPAAVRWATRAGIGLLPENWWDALLKCASKAPDALNGHKLRKYAAILGEPDRQKRYELMISRWFNPEDVLVRRPEESPLAADFQLSDALDPVDMMALWDLNTYLPDDVLNKLDRTSMAVSLESRVPILDNDVVAFALRLPLSVKRRQNEGKWILRQVLRRYLPESFIMGPKKGFSVPVAEWLRGPLREWSEELLSPVNLATHGLFNPAAVRRKWAEHVSGRRNWDKLLWPVIMFQAWSGSWR
jgi:asparagine synthase (glutamine-hydrolysing)